MVLQLCLVALDAVSRAGCIRIAVTVHASVDHVSFMVPCFRVVELFEGEDDDEKDDEVCNEAEHPSGSEAVRNLFPIIVGIILRPRANIAEHIRHWYEEQNLDEDVPPFLDGSNNNINDNANECDDDQEEERSDAAL